MINYDKSYKVLFKTEQEQQVLLVTKRQQTILQMWIAVQKCVPS